MENITETAQQNEKKGNKYRRREFSNSSGENESNKKKWISRFL